MSTQPPPSSSPPSGGPKPAPAVSRKTQASTKALPRPRTRAEVLKLGDLLVAAGLLNNQLLDQALTMAKRTGERLGEVLVKAGFVRPDEIAKALAHQFQCDYIAPRDVKVHMVDREAVRAVGVKPLQERRLLPIIHEGEPYLLLSDPLDTEATDRVESVIGKRPYALSTAGAIETLIVNIAFETVDADKIIESARESIDQGEIKTLFEFIMSKAVLENATDVHIEPTGLTTVVRIRVNGELRTALSLPRSRHENLANIIFGMAGVDLSDFARLHDGRFSFMFGGRKLDIRFASSPTVEGPMIVLRILAETGSLATLEELGYTSWNLQVINQILRYPFGLLLVVGPTGSGKTTTLYSCLSRLNDGVTKILTVEDPVEIRLPSIQQVQVNEKAEVTFARTVRAFLRQDPDVILVGEIRDEETAREAFRAANTGHLVLSTLHANTAVEAFGRLLDLGMAPYQVSVTLLGSMSQRLVRKLCPQCKRRSRLDLSTVDPVLLDSVFRGKERPTHTVEVFEAGSGCDQCSGGYKGRTVVGEVLQLDTELRELIYQRGSNEQIVQSAKKRGFLTMADNGLWLVLKGLASLADAEQAVGPMTLEVL